MSERRFKTVVEFIQNCQELTEEEYAAELSHFSAVDKANITATEYIEYGIYPANRFDRGLVKGCLTVGGKKYYPIVGWNPDLVPASSEVKISPIRKWLNRQPKRRLHNSRENKTYVLYG